MLGDLHRNRILRRVGQPPRLVDLRAALDQRQRPVPSIGPVLATGTATSWEVAPLYEDLLEGTDIEFVRGDVTGLDEGERVVRVAASPLE